MKQNPDIDASRADKTTFINAHACPACKRRVRNLLRYGCSREAFEKLDRAGGSAKPDKSHERGNS